MIILKVDIYTNGQGLEATWIDRVQAPDVVIPAKVAVYDAEGNEVSPAEPERVELGAVTETQLWCQSYHPTQMQMFREKSSEFGTSVAEYESEMHRIEAEYVPEPEPSVDYSALRAAAYSAESDPIFFEEQRGEVPIGTWLAKIEEIRARWPR